MNNSTTKSAINRRDMEERIIKVIDKSGKPLSTDEIAKEIDKSWHTIIRYCLDLEIRGKIYKFSIGRISAWQVRK
ncbi:MAG: hypothetical protein AABX11_04085 [Nanoarchaeota archaeon]